MKLFLSQPGEEGIAGGHGEWLLQSALHVAAYSGDKERLLEILEESECAVVRSIMGFTEGVTLTWPCGRL